MNIPALPAVSYMRIVKQFALAKGIKFFTYKDLVNASILYLEYAKFKN